MTIPPATPSALPHGIYCPTVSFFRPTAEQELDTETFAQHVEFLAKSGLQGIVIGGSNGEAVALDREEMVESIRLAARVFKQYAPHGTIVAGTAAAQTTREAIQRTREAAEAGAEYALVLPPSYYPGALSPAAIQSFYEDVADASPIPLVIYSYPAVSSGIVMDTDLVGRLAKHPNIAGIKHTDHEVGRIAREAAVAAKSNGSSFTVLGGASDYLIGTLSVGGKGAITGMANITPRVLVKVYDLFQAGARDQALELAGLVSRSEWAIGKGGILGTKHAIQWANSYPSSASAGRKPLPPVAEAVRASVESELQEIVALERQLERETGNASPKAKPNGVPGIATDGHSNANGGALDGLKQKLAALQA